MSERKRIAVVTGGSSGLGKACADLFAKQGTRVIVVDLKVDEITEEGTELIEGFAADVTSEKDINNLAEYIKLKYKRVDIVVNCAGIAQRCLIFDFTTDTPHSLEHFSKIIQVNTVGTFNVIRTLLPIMAKNEPDFDGERGVIINISSILGLEGTTGFTAYSASKAAIAGMTLPLAREFGPHGIRVNAIAPGFCDTPIFNAAYKELVHEKVIPRMPFPKRMLRPDEFADLVSSIVENHAINAATIRLDGGFRTSL